MGGPFFKEQSCSQVTSEDLAKARRSVSSAWQRCFPPLPIFAALRVPRNSCASKRTFSQRMLWRTALAEDNDFCVSKSMLYSATHRSFNGEMLALTFSTPASCTAACANFCSKCAGLPFPICSAASLVIGEVKLKPWLELVDDFPKLELLLLRFFKADTNRRMHPWEETSWAAGSAQ